MFGFQMPSIEDLCKGRWGNTKQVIESTCEHAGQMRQAHRFAKNGYWLDDKSRTFQTIARIPARIFCILTLGKDIGIHK